MSYDLAKLEMAAEKLGVQNLDEPFLTKWFV